ncbi:DivIVA domain-containing protein [Corynebacterium pelargi]|uniref:Cell wall synthesis protein Wag31 n=1 Tax=Corynebacterium pelargi TaxID=1471400 RepID=A0A410W7W3_9CORY|nr:DivIVA domain-containing protein [Corynebacterium pelargi]QAU52047.1 Cell wall synthesis protein Wag31 [Corynebacterium pelargi]GGG70536.1 cell division initiation protein [Corynebacterium pelargi]
MPLTPADVHNVAFSKPPIGKRGYNEDEVDQFLDLVEDTLAEIQEENEDLRQQVEELKAEAGQSGPAPVRTASSTDESKIREEIEASLKAEYEGKLADARRAAEQAQGELASARKELKSAQEEARRAKSAGAQPQAAAAAPVATDEPASAETHMQAAKVLSLAQEMADRLTSDARAESDSMLTEAREAAEQRVREADEHAKRTVSEAEQKAHAQLSDAKQRSETMVAEAKQKSEKTIADANAQAEAQVRKAEDKANALQADAERKHTEIMATVKQQQNALETRIAELRTFEREYRTRLKTLLQSQLEDLESRSTSAPEGR